MSNAVLTQAAYRLDFEWEFGDPVSISFVVEDEDISGTYECVIRDAERDGDIIAQPAVATLYVPNDGTQFDITMTQAAALEVPMGRWWVSVYETSGVTRFSGRVQVTDGGHRPLGYAATLDTSVVFSTDLVEVVS